MKDKNIMIPETLPLSSALVFSEIKDKLLGKPKPRDKPKKMLLNTQIAVPPIKGSDIVVKMPVNTQTDRKILRLSFLPKKLPTSAQKTEKL